MLKFCKFFIIYPSSFDPEIHLLELSSLPSIYSARGGGEGGEGEGGGGEEYFPLSVS